MPGKNWRKIAERLWRMDRQEIWDRSRQEISKRSDSSLGRLGFDFTKQEPRSPAASPGTFFFGSNNIPALLELIRYRLPEAVQNTIARADRICAHRFDLLGYENLDYRERIDWHRDAVHGKTAPLKPFHRVRYLDFGEVGDSKVTWELNRHQHLVILAKAYRITGEERYAEEIHSQWRAWHIANPYPMGINWASSLEVAFRSLSWIWVYRLLEGTPALDSDFRREWLKAQALNGRHIARYLSTYFSPNTHLLGEGVALFFLGALCPALSGAERWKKRGWQIIQEEARRQVNSDGLHFEGSIYYHVYALDFFLHAALLAEANEITVPEEFRQMLQRMLEALSHLSVCAPPPRFGDDDGGRLFDPARNRSHHLLDPLASGAVLFSRGDFKHLAGSLREETIWLLGQEGVEKWDRLTAKPVAATSKAFEASGVFVLAAGHSQLVICGASTLTQSYGHSHADALGISLQSRGLNLLIDSGTGEYVGEANIRNLFRSTPMHNTLRVDEKDQSEPDGPFSWKHFVRARAEQWMAGESFSLFVGSHDGYRRLQSPVEHRRWVIALRPGIFLVRDLVRDLANESAEHRLDISWHLAPELRRYREGAFQIAAEAGGLAILAFEDYGWEADIRETAWSPVYGQRQATTELNFKARRRLPAEFVTLLVPIEDVEKNVGKFTCMNSAGSASTVRAYRYQTDTTDFRFFFATKDQKWEREEISSDAEFLCLSAPSIAPEPDVILCNGSYAEIDGVTLLRTRRAVRWCELTHSDIRKMFCSDKEALTPAETLAPSNLK